LLSRYDVNTGKIEVVGDLIPADDLTDLDDQHSFVAGMDFDKDGVLWYATMSFRAMEDEHYKVPACFFRWDIKNEKNPEFLGLFGTSNRVQTYTDSFMIDKKRDILYSVSTNHSFGSPDVIAIDLKKFRENMYEKGEICKDMLVYAPGHEEYHEFAEHWQDIKIKIAKYSANFKAKKISPVRLWNKFSNTNIDNAKIKGLAFIDNDNIEGICGETENFYFLIKNGKLQSIRNATNIEVERIVKTTPKNIDGLPFYPGRQWRAIASAECDYIGDSKLIGTQDGFLVKVRKDGSVYSIGPAICQGPIRALCSNNGVCYGVGGDEEDIGNVFKYTEEKGLEYLGFTCSDAPDNDVGVCANFILSSIAISPNGKKLVIGAMDRLACAYVCDIE
jgi:hypothetical protein